jgi:hypothetical protein
VNLSTRYQCANTEVAKVYNNPSSAVDKEHANLRQHHKAQRGKRTLLAAMWIIMLSFSFITIGLLTESFLRPTAGSKLASSDWGGYVVVSDRINPSPVFLNISASWAVPSVKSSQTDTFSAVWIGIGGQLDNTLIQTGTEQDLIDGQPYYSTWYEMLPADSVPIDAINVSPGDEISASISLVDVTNNRWLVQITDLTNGQAFNQTFVYFSSRLSAEWIVERPTVNDSIAALASFGSATFRNAQTSTDSKSGTIVDFPFSQVTMVDRGGNPLVDVSSVSYEGSSFTVNCLV